MIVGKTTRVKSQLTRSTDRLLQPGFSAVSSGSRATAGIAPQRHLMSPTYRYLFPNAKFLFNLTPAGKLTISNSCIAPPTSEVGDEREHRTASTAVEHTGAYHKQLTN